MQNKISARLAHLFFLAAVSFGACQVGAAPLPLTAFGHLPAIQSASLSPDGQRVVMLLNTEGTSTIVTQGVDGGGQLSQVLATDKFKFNWVRWANNERLLVSLIFPSKRYSVETTETRLLSVRYDGAKPLNLVLPQYFRGEYQSQFQDQIVDFRPDPQHVLMEVSNGSISADPAVFSVDLEKGTRREVHPSRTDFSDWMTDQTHRVRVGTFHDKANIEVHVSDADGTNWRRAWAYKILGKDRVRPLGFGKDPNVLYISADHNGRQAVFTVDLRDPALKRTLKLANDKYDLNGSLVHAPNSGEAVGIRDVINGRSETSYWDPGYRDFMLSINEALPKRFNRLVGMSDDGARYLVYSSNDTHAGEYYIGDNRKDDLKLLANAFPDLPVAQMVEKKPVTIAARDGLKLPGYLSLPQGQAAGNLPAVLLVHGGPQGADNGDFDSWVQFLANRGYAVLQVNFRGSTGFGSQMVAAGLRRWGQEMQDDLTDATKWLANGTADPKRICIVGASYGGYAALMGAARAPELYRCAVSFAGVTDLVELALDAGQFRNMKEAFEAQIGSADTDRERLRATSPRFLAAKMGVPLLLMHGTQDRSVPYVQATLMTEALEKAGKPFRFVRQEGGDHHLSVYAHRLEFFTELERFLATNLTPVAGQAR
jgi:dipeptidyl aminopeptidase/acylaminoacyl peptidase